MITVCIQKDDEVIASLLIQRLNESRSIIPADEQQLADYEVTLVVDQVEGVSGKTRILLAFPRMTTDSAGLLKAALNLFEDEDFRLPQTIERLGEVEAGSRHLARRLKDSLRALQSRQRQ